MKRSIGFLVLLLLSTTMTAVAAPKAHAKFSDNQLVRILKSEGFSTVVKLEKEVIGIKVDGRKYLLVNMKNGDLGLFHLVPGANLSYKSLNT